MLGPELDTEGLRPELAGRWILIFGGSQTAADEFARRQVTPPIATVGRDELFESRLSAVRRRPFDAAVLLSSSWDRQRNRQLYGAALASASAKKRFIIDSTTGRVRSISLVDRLGLFSALPASLAMAAGSVAVEAAGFEVRRRLHKAATGRSRSQGHSVLAIWIGSEGAPVGGSVSHISGILHGLRSAGAKVGLLTAEEPPPQLARSIDDMELIPPLATSALLTGDIEKITANHPARHAGMRLAARLRPTLVYQRHQAFLTAGSDIASAIKVPLVLEWNASEVWVRANWNRALRVEKLLDPFLAATELYVLHQSFLVAAVSRTAGLMAAGLGVDESRIITLPNGVDVEDVDRAVGAIQKTAPMPRRIGWIGSFGPWHGAEIAIEALAELPADVELIMIGEGERLGPCRQLADSLGVSTRVIWEGLLAHDDALRRLATCSVLLSPHVPIPGQEFFGSPTKLFEYMALERPIVASRLGQLAEVLEDRRTAVLVEPGNPKALAAAIQELLEAPDWGRQLAAAARRQVVSSHTWDARGRQLLDAVGAVRLEAASP